MIYDLEGMKDENAFVGILKNIVWRMRVNGKGNGTRDTGKDIRLPFPVSRFPFPVSRSPILMLYLVPRISISR